LERGKTKGGKGSGGGKHIDKEPREQREEGKGGLKWEAAARQAMETDEVGVSIQTKTGQATPLMVKEAKNPIDRLQEKKNCKSGRTVEKKTKE